MKNNVKLMPRFDHLGFIMIKIVALIPNFGLPIVRLDFNKSKSFLFGTAFVMSKGLKKAKTLLVEPYMAL